MNNVPYKILDCTKDGGYYTDWHFTDDLHEYLTACANRRFQ